MPSGRLKTPQPFFLHVSERRRGSCIIRELGDEEAIILSLIENVQRSDLTPARGRGSLSQIEELEPEQMDAGGVR